MKSFFFILILVVVQFFGCKPDCSVAFPVAIYRLGLSNRYEANFDEAGRLLKVHEHDPGGTGIWGAYLSHDETVEIIRKSKSIELQWESFDGDDGVHYYYNQKLHLDEDGLCKKMTHSNSNPTSYDFFYSTTGFLELVTTEFNGVTDTLCLLEFENENLKRAFNFNSGSEYEFEYSAEPETMPWNLQQEIISDWMAMLDCFGKGSKNRVKLMRHRHIDSDGQPTNNWHNIAAFYEFDQCGRFEWLNAAPGAEYRFVY